MSANQQKRILELPLLSHSEPHQVPAEWNQTARDYPRDKCVHQLFEEQVERTPEAVAVVFEDQQLTYRELNARANQLAHHLRSLGVGPDVLVGLCVERSLEMVVGLLGILKAGGAYVPLDLGPPQDRVTLILKDSGVALVVTQSWHADTWCERPVRVLCLDTEHKKITTYVTDAPTARHSTELLAYVIFTSGSTGRPKGVAVEHRQIVTYLQWAGKIYCAGDGSGAPVQSPLTFDLTVTSLLLPLVCGRIAFLIPEQESISALADALKQNCDFSFVKLTPSHLEALDAILGDANIGRSTRSFIVGGEPFPASLCVRWQLRVPLARFINEYGPTETTVGCCIHEVSPEDIRSGAIPIGKAVPGTQLYILDPGLQPVAGGACGELFIGGAQLGRGYLNRPELTAEKFVPDPFSPEPGARLYRTGDLARYLPDGNIEFIGRMDHQVKIRGHRVELGEVESVLGGHPNVSACAVVTRCDGAGDKTLAAFLVGRKRGGLSVESLRQWLGEKLPDYMIPSRFSVLPALPLTPNGKVDRKALEKLDGPELVSGTEYVAPRNDLESKLAEIWQAVLRRERVGVHANFFAMGGHSLLAVSIASQIASRLQVEVPLRWLFEHPTIEGLTRHLESQPGRSQNTLSLEKIDRDQPMPMSFAQQRMWLLQQTLPDLATYNQPVAFRLSGQVDRERMRRSLQALVERHEVLRTALVQQGESLVQQIAAEIPLPWLEVDLQAVPASQQPAALEERLLEEARRPFDLAQAPLWRAVWITLAGNEQVLEIIFHHSIVDEWTLRIFFQEWQQLYATDGRLELAGLPELPVQYADYAVWQRQRLTGELLEQQRSYWREQLQDLPPALELPTDRARPVRLSGRGAVHDFQLSGPVVTRLRELAREEGATLFTLMLAAFQVWLHRYTGQNDLVVGTPLTDRERPGIQSLLGFFLNTLPIRARLDGSPSFRQVLRQVRELLMGALSHAGLPFEQMVEMAVKERDPGHQPLYQVMFVLLEEGLPAFRLDQAEARPLPVETQTSKNDLTLNIEAVGETWKCRFEYATDLFTAETAARMGRHLTELLRSINEEPGMSISQLNLMPAAERHQVLVEWNQTERNYPRDKCVHQLFEEQVERTPEAVAVVFEDHPVTYRELNARANRLAHSLRARDVAREDCVGVMLERSLDFVVAVLGILKAGGAYVPIERDLPPARLRLMLRNAAPRLVLGRASLPTGSVSDADVRFVDWDALESAMAGACGTNPESVNVAGDLAYVMYTSGSTGEPKGVAVPQRAVTRLVFGNDYLPFDDRQTFLLLAPTAFDASTLELWGPLLHGSKLVVYPEGPLELTQLGTMIKQHGVTCLWLTSTLFNAVIDQQPEALSSVRHLLIGGEALSIGFVRRALACLPQTRIINGYGPTEGTTFTTTYTIGGALTHDMVSVPIGRPLANTRVYVLDEARRPVIVGGRGELYIGGDGLGRGYLNRADLTEERFMPDPFCPGGDGRMYRTGDLVRWREDGNMEFIGRVDHQVKVRGHRIELSEVEAALGRHPQVGQCVVMARDDDGHGNRLVAYVVRNEATPAIAILRSCLADQLPAYMIPAEFVFLERMPVNENGKVSHKLLPYPVLQRPQAATKE